MSSWANCPYCGDPILSCCCDKGATPRRGPTNDYLDPYPSPRNKEPPPKKYIWTVSGLERESLLQAMKDREGVLNRTAREVATRVEFSEVTELCRMAEWIGALRKRLEEVQPS